MGWNDDSGAFSRDEKRQMQAAFLVPVGVFILAIGFSVGNWWIILFGAACLITGGFDVYKRFKARKDAKSIARDEAEIRAYNLRQARGQ